MQWYLWEIWCKIFCVQMVQVCFKWDVATYAINFKMRIHSSTLISAWQMTRFFIFFQKDCYIYHEFTNMAAKNTLDMTLRQVDAHHIWWSASGLATFHQEPMFTFVAAQNHLNRSGQVCRSLQKNILKCWCQSEWIFRSYLPSTEMSWISDHFVWLPNSKRINQQLLSLRSFCCTSFSYFWPDQWPTTSSCSHHSSMDSFQDQSGVLYIPESFPLNHADRRYWGISSKSLNCECHAPPTFLGSSYMALSKLRKRNQESQKRFLVTW